jgi:hypothetical protein
MPSWKLHNFHFELGEIVSVNARLSILGRISYSNRRLSGASLEAMLGRPVVCFLCYMCVPEMVMRDRLATVPAIAIPSFFLGF